MGKWYPVGDCRSIDCDVFSTPDATSAISRQWLKHATIEIFNTSRTGIISQMIEKQTHKYAMFKPIGSTEETSVFKDLTSNGRGKIGYVQFQTDEGKGNIMELTYYEESSMFVAKWVFEHDKISEALRHLRESVLDKEKEEMATYGKVTTVKNA